MSETSTQLIPYLCCRGAEAAAEFYQKAFGATVHGIHKMPDGKVMHAAVTIEGNTIFLVDEMPEWGALSPLSLGNTPVTLHLHVPDCDSVFSRAAEAGCTVVMPLEDQFWGDRYGLLKDPYGHNWSIATTLRKVSEDEIQQAMASMGECAGTPAA